MSNELTRLNRIRAVANILLSCIGIVAGLAGYFVSVGTQDYANLGGGIGVMLLMLILLVVGNYVAGILELSIDQLEEVRARVDKEVGTNETEAS